MPCREAILPPLEYLIFGKFPFASGFTLSRSAAGNKFFERTDFVNDSKQS